MRILSDSTRVIRPKEKGFLPTRAPSRKDGAYSSPGMIGWFGPSPSWQPGDVTPDSFKDIVSTSPPGLPRSGPAISFFPMVSAENMILLLFYGSLYVP